MVQALAHHYRRNPSDSHLTELQVLLGGVCQTDRFLDLLQASSCLTTMEAAGWSKRWPGITSSTPSALQWTKPCGQPNFSGNKESLQDRFGASMKQDEDEAAPLATVALAWFGTPKGRSRA